MPDSRLSALDLAYTTSALAPLLPSFEGKIILLTGGTGLFGKWLLETYIALHTSHPFSGEIHILSRNPARFLAQNPYFSQFPFLKFHSGDTRNAEIPVSHVDYVLHAATEASAKLEKENPDEMYSVVADGTRHILDIARKLEASRFLLTSSGAVYGSQPPQLSHLPETFPCSPVTAYGRGKLLAENLVLETAAKTGLEAVIPRCFAFVGPYLNLDIHFAVGNFIRSVLKRDPIRILGDGTPFRSYLYMSELAVWLWTLLLKAPSGSIYNVGSSEPISILNLAKTVCKAAQVPETIEVMQKPNPCALPPRYVPNVEKIREEMGLCAEISLKDALRKTLEFEKVGNEEQNL